MVKLLKRIVRFLNPKRIVFRSQFIPKRVIYTLDESKEDYFHSFEFKPQSEIPSKNDSAQLYSLIGGRIDTDNDKTVVVVNSDNEMLAEPSFHYRNGRYVQPEENIVFTSTYYSDQPKALDGTVFSLLSGGGSSKNYYHWLFDSLSRIHILQSSGTDLDDIDYILVPGPIQGYKLKALESLGLSSEKIVNSQFHRHITANKLLLTSHPNDPSAPMPEWIPGFLKELFGEFRQLPDSRAKIFISRSQAKTRRLVNEEEVFSYLEQKGFVKVFLEEMAFEKQVSLFSNVETIVSPHGAGMANLVFCKAETRVIELFPNNSNSLIYQELAELTNLQYSKLNELVNDTSLTPDLHVDFKIELSDLQEILE
ncbi:glycosyltransferase family 61 protein [Aureicoccus marinus]|uniref:Glycosyltransferase 61 catalytic domain-containing protein n=1 Tax=Aureicoccus marinus TaxID=754435 RepID=A0A2S7T6M8_9FLAO|nr:glycosyltransferase family 61 protein [Aureicoccus marinus]PQJ15241.1 hypothetical protein BST99_05405 [Aureicoccus marinus]